MCQAVGEFCQSSAASGALGAPRRTHDSLAEVTVVGVHVGRAQGGTLVSKYNLWK